MTTIKITFEHKPETKSIAAVVTKSVIGPDNEEIESSFKLIDTKIAALMAKGGKSAAEILGDIILNTLELNIDGGIGQSKLNEHLNDMKKTVSDLAQTGDVGAQALLGSMYADDALAKKDITLLVVAEEWFRKAADTGDEGSKSFFKDQWPSLKKDYETRINKN